jgi:hypothetical protein
MDLEPSQPYTRGKVVREVYDVGILLVLFIFFMGITPKESHNAIARERPGL